MSNRNMDVLGRIIQKADPKLYDTLFYSDDGLELLKIVRRKNANNEVEFAIEIDGVINPYAKSAEVTEEINQKIAALGTVFSFKGVVETLSDLPQDNNEPGYVYHVKELESEYVWIDDDGTEKWEELGPVKVAQADYALVAREAIEADQLASDRQIENADEACPPITFGAIGGTAEVQDGYSKFEELRGNTICWNQLLKNPGFVDETFQWSSYRLTHTESNGICSYLATQANPNMYQNISRISGHKYLITVRVKLTSATEANPYFKIAFAGSTAYAALNTNWQFLSFIVTAPSSVTATLDIIDERTSDWDVVQISNVCLFDLTQMFGAGNEPTTVEEFTSQFPDPYYAYNAGQLLSSKSASMILRGINQLNLNRTAGTLSGFGNDNPRAFEEGKYYSGLTVNNYYSPNNVSDVVVTSGSVTFTNSASGYGIALPMRVIPGQTYLAEVKNVTNNSVGISWYDKNGYLISFGGNSTYYHSAQAPVNAYWGVVIFGPTAGTHTYTEIQFRLYYDTPNLPYSAYDQQVVTLPNLELKSAGSAYDVAYQTGGGKRRIGSVDLGTLDYTKVTLASNREAFVFSSFASNKNAKIADATGAVAPNMISPKWISVSQAAAWVAGDMTILATQGTAGNRGDLVFVTVSNTYSDATAFKTAMSGVYLYYELAEEIDITTTENPGWIELVKIDNFGTIEFTVDPAQTPQVPQAYFIRYTVNLGEWVDTAYVKTNGDANNIITPSDFPSTTKFGAVKLFNGGGIIWSNESGFIGLRTDYAQPNDLKAGSNSYAGLCKPVVPYQQHLSAFYGLAKAAGYNLYYHNEGTAPSLAAAASDPTPGIYSPNAIQAILKMILPAAPTTDGTYDLVCTVSGGTPTFSWVART